MRLSLKLSGKKFKWHYARINEERADDCFLEIVQLDQIGKGQVVQLSRDDTIALRRWMAGHDFRRWQKKHGTKKPVENENGKPVINV